MLLIEFLIQRKLKTRILLGNHATKIEITPESDITKETMLNLAENLVVSVTSVKKGHFGRDCPKRSNNPQRIIHNEM